MRWCCLLICCGTVLASVLIWWHPQRLMEHYWCVQLSGNHISVVRRLQTALLSRVGAENEILSVRDCTASNLSGCIRIIYLNAVCGRQAGRFPPPYLGSIHVHFAVNEWWMTWPFWGASMWMFVANFTNFHQGGPEKWFMSPRLWKVKNK